MAFFGLDQSQDRHVVIPIPSQEQKVPNQAQVITNKSQVQIKHYQTNSVVKTNKSKVKLEVKNKSLEKNID